MSVFTVSSDYPFSYSSIQEMLFSYGSSVGTSVYRQNGYDRALSNQNEVILMEEKVVDLTRLNTDLAQFSCFDKRDKIILPERISPELALETGYSLGDGFISKVKYEYRLKGNKNDEKEFYEKIVKPLYKILYNLDVSVKDYETTVGFEKCSKALWEFKVKVLGIKSGRKTDIRVPTVFMKQNDEVLGKLLQGLLDTDGNIYFRSQGKRKSYYPIVSIETISRGLATDIFAIFERLGFKPYFWESKKARVSNPSGRFLVRISGYKNFDLYKKLIGSKQPKNINKLKAWEERFGK